jgi:holo-[acyl-carrier protein] synthase
VIVGLGIDFIDSGRVERELARCPWTPQDGIFTASEIDFCNSKRKSALLYASCFVAKEATLKALGLEVTNLSLFRDVELLRGPEGKAVLRLHGQARSVSQKQGVRRLSVAVTTTARLSGAVVVLES